MGVPCELLTQPSGNVKEEDCADVASGSITEDVGRCQTDYTGRPRDDCEFMKVGDLIWSIPVSFPVSDRMLHTMSWAFTYALSNGVMEDMKRLNSDLFPVSQCEAVEDRSEEDGLHLADLSGTFFVSMFIVLLGLACCTGQALGRRLQPKQTEATEATEASGADEPSPAPEVVRTV